MFGYIYKTTNKVNNKVYIGQHQAEMFEPDKYLGSGTLLRRAIKKYGKENFTNELLESCDSKESLDAAEVKWIAFYEAQDIDRGYNIASGGGGGSGPRSEKTKQRLSEYNHQVTAMNNGEITVRIPLDKVDAYKAKGFVKGCIPYKRSEEFKKKVSATNSNKVCMSKDGIQRRIPIDRVEEFLASGWKRGWNKTRPYISKVREGTGQRKFMFDGERYELVHQSNWQEYLDKGWVFQGPTTGVSRTYTPTNRVVSEETRQKLRDSHIGVKHSRDRVERHREKLSGRKYMTKDGKSKLVPKGEEESYLQQGWSYGKAPRK